MKKWTGTNNNTIFEYPRQKLLLILSIEMLLRSLMCSYEWSGVDVVIRKTFLVLALVVRHSSRLFWQLFDDFLDFLVDLNGGLPVQRHSETGVSDRNEM